MVGIHHSGSDSHHQLSAGLRDASFALKFKQWGFKGNEVKYGFAALTLIILATSVALDGLTGFLTGWWLVIVAYVIISAIIYLKKTK